MSDELNIIKNNVVFLSGRVQNLEEHHNMGQEAMQIANHLIDTTHTDMLSYDARISGFELRARASDLRATNTEDLAIVMELKA